MKKASMLGEKRKTAMGLPAGDYHRVMGIWPPGRCDQWRSGLAGTNPAGGNSY
ncbi:MAG: hypothetical protein M0Z50_11155 [Planctomycetia bacterium]|nr:hypothetical protein [Planctomycetia bacterium]